MSAMETAEAKPAAKLRVLVVDDSAFVRKVVKEMLSGAGIDVVSSARDGEEALALTESLRPDVVVCDLMMPKLNGVDYIRQQMKIRPLPILVLSAAAQNASEVIDALAAGAIDVVTKPNALATDDLRAVRDDLVGKLLGTSSASPRGLETVVAPKPIQQKKAAGPTKVDIVVIGISTGGPQALRRMIPMLSAAFTVPIAIVLHMPVGYTAMYAEKLNELSALEVKEAHDGDVMTAGKVYVAQAGRHLSVRRTAEGTVVSQLTLQPMDKIHRPSADVLFKSAADVYRDRVLAVVMTGMGDDGMEGCAWVKAQGGTVFTEDEKSCIIYGMPRSVVEAGLSDASYSLDDMAQAITSRI